MRSSTKKTFSLAALVVALVAAGSLVPLAYRHRLAKPPESTVAAVPSPAPAPAPAPEPAPAAGVEPEPAAPPAPPGAEVVPAEESETDHGPASTSPAGPTLSFARSAGLNRTPDPLRLNSSVALLVDHSTGEVLVQKNDQAVLPVASLTKMMTGLLVAEAKQPMDEILTITQEDVDTERHSRSRLKVGTTLTREEALHLALMSSENRAAHALGRTYPGGLQKMVEAMNARAKALGMKNTSYVDPTGLSSRNQSTARDLAILVGAVAKNPVLADFSTTPTHLATLGNRTLQYRNSNRLVRSSSGRWDIGFQKTGYIVEAGRCLTMLTKLGGHDLIMVLLDADTNNARLADAERMRRWVVAQRGLTDNVAQSKPAKEESERKVAKKSAKSEAKGSTVVARKDRPKKSKAGKAADSSNAPASKKNEDTEADDAQEAKAPGDRKQGDKLAHKKGKAAIAAKKQDEDRKPARVRHTFESGKQTQKS
jgi:serine-type D-Ala-D-Ala endopeptidase (penicillin-binding protein 7)